MKVNGVSSVVIYSNGDHMTKVMTQQFQSIPWEGGYTHVDCGATTDDGYENTLRILEKTSTCEAVNYCRSLGKEWYLPSLAEIEWVGQNKSDIYTSLPLPASNVFFWTSNEYEPDVNQAWNVRITGGKPEIFSTKNDKWMSLPVVAMKIL